MNKEFNKRLFEYLDAECFDYDLKYDWEWNEDIQCCEVTITRDDNSIVLNFRYSENNKDLTIELSEDSWYETREYDSSVKYFWMLVSPELFK